MSSASSSSLGLPTGHGDSCSSSVSPTPTTADFLSGTFVLESKLHHLGAAHAQDRVLLVIGLPRSAAAPGLQVQVDVGVSVGGLTGCTSDAASLLHSAIRSDQEDVVKLLLMSGAPLVGAPGTETLLQMAVKAQISLLLISLLISAGAPVETSLGSVTLLHMAVEAQNLEMVRLLIKSNAPLETGAGRPPLLNVAFETDQFQMVKTLLDAGAPRSDVLPAVRSSPCEVGGPFKYSGIATVGSKCFCAPYHASAVLVYDGATGETRHIPCGEESMFKWAGIAAVGDRLFCAPYNSPNVLVINATTEVVSTIPVRVGGEAKWCGIVAVQPTEFMSGAKLFCGAPDSPARSDMSSSDRYSDSIELMTQ